MDLASITAGFSGLSYAKDILTTVLKAKVETDTVIKIQEVLQKLGGAQDALFQLREELAKYQSENEELKKQLNEMHKWEDRSKNYRLTETEAGAIVYESLFEPRHFACPACFEKRDIGILQDRRVVGGVFDCPACKAVYRVKSIRR